MKAVEVKANGDAGYQDPQTGLYISSINPSIVPYTAWLENFVNHNKIELIREVHTDWATYIDTVRANGGDYEAAAIEDTAEAVVVADSPADVDEDEDGKPVRRRRTAKVEADKE